MTIFGLTKDQWDVINGLANWLAAFGTITAVIVSLWLARRQGSPRGKINAYSGNVFFDKDSPNNGECLVVNVVNTGDRPITITSISLSVGLIRKKYFGMRLPRKGTSDPLPMELTYGREGTWYFHTNNEGRNWFTFLAENLICHRFTMPLNNVRIIANTASGHRIHERADETVVTELRKAIDAAKRKC